jgi:hypothetical protein
MYVRVVTGGSGSRRGRRVGCDRELLCKGFYEEDPRVPDEPEFRRELDLVVNLPPLQLRAGALLSFREDPETEGEIVGQLRLDPDEPGDPPRRSQARPENFFTILPGFVAVGTPGRKENVTRITSRPWSVSRPTIRMS